mgnify:CR=1 FL=1
MMCSRWEISFESICMLLLFYQEIMSLSRHAVATGLTEHGATEIAPSVHHFSRCRLAMVMPLSMAPTMPRKPWSVPHRNRLLSGVWPFTHFSGAP